MRTGKTIQQPCQVLQINNHLSEAWCRQTGAGARRCCIAAVMDGLCQGTLNHSHHFNNLAAYHTTGWRDRALKVPDLLPDPAPARHCQPGQRSCLRAWVPVPCVDKLLESFTPGGLRTTRGSRWTQLGAASSGSAAGRLRVHPRRSSLNFPAGRSSSPAAALGQRSVVPSRPDASPSAGTALASLQQRQPRGDQQHQNSAPSAH